jgi:hypothetical protein
MGYLVERDRSDSNGLDAGSLGLSSNEENFFQSQEFRNVIETIGWKTVFLESRRHGCHASVLAYARPTVPFFDRVLRSYKVFYGPCVRPLGGELGCEVLDCLLDRLCAVMKKQGALFLDVRTPFPSLYGAEVFAKNGFVISDFKGDYSVLIDLKKDLETLWKDMKRFARRNVKKAVEKGIEIKEVETLDDLHEVYKIYLETSTRRGFDSLPYRFFEALWTQLEPKGLVKFFIASWKKKSVAAILNTFYRGQSIPHVACSLNRFWSLHPNHVLFWHSIKWSKEVAGSTIFNLYHLPSQRDQTQPIDFYTFKTCFGGRLIEECASYRRIISPIKFKVSEVLSKKLPKWCQPHSFVRTRMNGLTSVLSR